LTSKGEAFVAAGYVFDESVSASGWPVFLRLISGFLHVLASVIWFGAIFYIHIFVKPTSLTGGLPRNERILGWVCIAIVGVTGTILTFLRVRSIEEFWTTTFGIVWVVKIFFFIIMVLIAAVATTRLNRRMREAQRSNNKDSLSKYDGKEGRSAYFVFNNELFDVSESKMWRNGVHMGRHYAGTDLSSEMADAPHGTEVFERVTKIGSASFQNVEKIIPAAAAFIFMAYFILFCMLMILFCVAYWNWGPSIITD
jgi:predicted heme/steroid binding protein